jgi:putative effector of murein hydrolase LrgA (UPF0299 family)
MVLLVKDLAGLINLSLPLAGNILSRVVLYILLTANGTRRSPTQPLCPLIARNMQYNFMTNNEIEKTLKYRSRN